MLKNKITNFLKPKEEPKSLTPEEKFEKEMREAGHDNWEYAFP